MESIPPNASWIGKFAARLLRLEPELTALEAVRIARQQLAMDASPDPVEAPENYFNESGSGGNG